jgi:uncharacterized membrane protein
VFLLVRGVTTTDKVMVELAKYGGKALRTRLSRDAEVRLHAAQQQQAGSPAAGPQG